MQKADPRGVLIDMNETRAIPKRRRPKRALDTSPRPFLRRVGAWVYGCYAWGIFTTHVLCFGLLAILSGQRNRARRLARLFAGLMFRFCRIPLSSRGLECLPARPHVLLVNHTSFLDALALIALLPASPGYTFTTRQEFRLQGLLYPLLKSVHTIVLRHHSETGHTGNIETLESALTRGENLLVFPEGAFAAEPGVKPFHSGAFIAASATGVPLVIAGLRGAREALPLGSWILRRRSIRLEVGAVLEPRGTNAEAVHALMEAARTAMVPLAGEPPVHPGKD